MRETQVELASMRVAIETVNDKLENQERIMTQIMQMLQPEPGKNAKRAWK